MSTRGTIADLRTDKIAILLYHEMHDNVHHLEITDPAGSYSCINVIVADWMVPGLKEMLVKQ